MREFKGGATGQRQAQPPSPVSLLILGIGNPGRGDDGLGPAFVNAVQALVEGDPRFHNECFNDERFHDPLCHDPCFEHVRMQENYQLCVEDALLLCECRTVLFVDACLQGEEAFTFTPLHPADPSNLGSHHLSPEQLMALTNVLYGHKPEAWVLAIRGYAFEQFEECLSEPARHNLNRAFEYFQSWWAERHSCGDSEAGHA